MKNNFTIIKDKVYIEVFCKKERMEAIIDLSDFGKADSHKGRWYAWYSKDNDSYYVCGWKNEEEKVKTFYLHRFLLDAPKGLVVDHRNHNTLDNTRDNMRLTTVSGNQSNLKRFTGVNYDGFTGKYRGRFKYLGKFYDLGRFPTYEEAKEAVLKKRAELTGE